LIDASSLLKGAGVYSIATGVFSNDAGGISIDVNSILKFASVLSLNLLIHSIKARRNRTESSQSSTFHSVSFK
jgi:hypothetical protein